MSIWIDIAWLVFASLFAFLGCALLAISQDRNWRTVMGGSPRPTTAQIARWTGWVFVFSALVACVMRDGGSFAALLWPLLLALAAFAVAMILAYEPRLLKFIGRSARVL